MPAPLLLHAVRGFEAQHMVAVDRPVEQGVGVLRLVARGLAAAAVRLAVGDVGADAQAEVVGQRATEQSTHLRGIAARLRIRLAVVIRDRATPFGTDLAGDDVDHPAHGVGAVQRGHRTAHHFDALDHVRRKPVEVLRAEVVAVVHAGRIALAAAVDEDQGVLLGQAAQADLGLRAGEGITAGDAGHGAEQLADAADRLALDFLAGDDADAGGRVADPLLGAGGGDYDGVEVGRVGSDLAVGVRLGGQGEGNGGGERGQGMDKRGG